MTSIHLQIDDDRMGLLRQRAAGSGFATPEAYVQSLLEADLKAADERALEAMLLERVKGPFVEMTDGDFGQMHDEVAARVRASVKR